MKRVYYVQCTCEDAAGYPNEHNTSEIMLLNVEEDIEGKDVVTFKCPVNNGIRKSYVYSGGY